MRRPSRTVLLVSLTLATACSGSSTGGASSGGASAGAGASSAAAGGDAAARVRAAGRLTSGTGSSRLALTSTSVVQGRTVAFEGAGAFDYGTHTGTLDLRVGGAAAGQGSTISERITGGVLYLTLPTAPGQFYRLRLSDLTGTSLAGSSDPTSTFGTLAGVQDGVTDEGSVDLRGTRTTHYTGTIDVQKAVDALNGTDKDLATRSLLANGVRTVPFEAYLDDQGRVRKFVQRVSVVAKDQKVDSTTSVELYDFGTKVVVTPPPAAQVQDGAPLLKALRRQAAG